MIQSEKIHDINIRCEKTELDGVLLIKPQLFEDHRGEYVELYNKENYRELFIKEFGKDINFVEDDISITIRHALKGIHGNDSCYKLISCIYGKFYLAVINYDASSPQYGRWQGFTLSDKNRLQIIVPPKFGNGHVALSEISIYYYKQSEYYDPKSQFTIKWNDPRFNIFWPIKNPILSKRDEVGHFVG